MNRRGRCEARRSQEVHLPRPGHADLVGTQKYKQSDVRNILERASARETAARVAGGGALQGVPGGAGRAGALARDPDRLGARARSPSGADVDGLRAGRRVAGALPGRRGEPGDGGRDQHAAQGQRVARRRLRGAGLRPRAGPRLARLLGGAPGRPPGDGDPLDPGDEGRLDRRRLSDRRAARLAGARRDLLLRASAATTARPTAPAAWRAA